MKTMRDCGMPGVGLSSLGPTLFGVYDVRDSSMVAEMQEALGDTAEVLLTKGQNYGARIYQ